MGTQSNSNTELRGRKARMAVPTNNKERLVDQKSPIVTKTDLKGKITYANRAFCDIAGFTEAELLGQAHNVVRHPDMPRDAFKDLWDVVRTDRPWQGIVKNRCKDGGYYWVDAYVTPLTENGKKIGYMSVRGRPTDQQKQSAEALYKAINAGQAPFPFTKAPKTRSLGFDLAVLSVLPFAFAVGMIFAPPLIQYVLLALIAASAIGGYFWVRGRITHGAEALKSVMASLAEGDFKHQVPSSSVSEFSDLLISFKSMQVNLRAIVADVVSGASQVKHDADNLNALAAELMTRSEEQADGITGVAAALEELSVSVSEISEATNKSSDHATSAMHVVSEGSDSMDRSTQATEMVAQVVQGARQDIETLNRAVTQISKVTKTITDIAEKTNLLALNAAIEAARAGESGRGFAVVADEVRKLAEMTRQSTTEISQTVADVQSGTSRALGTMEVAVEKVNSSTQLIATANDSLHLIREASRGVAQSASDISAMLEQQSQASLEVATSMERMSMLTDRNVAGIKELDASAHTLAGTSQELRKLVAHFEKSL